jgi:hypothetical protein
MHSDNIQEPHTLIRTRGSIYVESQMEVHKSANDIFMVQITFFEVKQPQIALQWTQQMGLKLIKIAETRIGRILQCFYC